MVDANENLRNSAFSYLESGLSLVPCNASNKRPDAKLLPRNDAGKATWKPYQESRADKATVFRWFAQGCRSVAVACGKVSGGLLILDFDAPGFYERWCEAVGNLAAGLPVQRTGGGGYQVALRCPDPGRNDKLAWVKDEDPENPDGRRIAIETRGEGGYAVLPGSLHPSGNTYEAIGGDWCEIPIIPQAQADALLAAARKLDEAPLSRQDEQKEAAERERANRPARPKHNGEFSVIDAYNQAVTIEMALAGNGYSHKYGPRWAWKVGSGSPSVFVENGHSFHHSSNDPLHDEKWHDAFDLYCHFHHDNDKRAAVKAAAEELGLSTPRQAATPRQYDEAEAPWRDLDDFGDMPTGEPQPPRAFAHARADNKKEESGGGVPEWQKAFPCYTMAELAAMDLTIHYVFDRALIAGSPMIIGGREKSLKTHIAQDCAISMATATPWLGHFRCVQAARCVYFSGEGGLVTVREAMERIAAAKGYLLGDIPGLMICPRVPNLTSDSEMRLVGQLLTAHEAEFAVFDPLYLMMLSEQHNASNVFAMGAMLRRMLDACESAGATPIVCHHFRKNNESFGLPDLSDLAQAGCAEFAGQWLLINRQSEYDEDKPGEHDLLVRLGSRIGFSGKWAIRVEEGCVETGRFWDVSVLPAKEAKKKTKEEKEAAREAAARDGVLHRLEEGRKKIVNAMLKMGKPCCQKDMQELSGVGKNSISTYWHSLVQDGTIVHRGTERREKTTVNLYYFPDDPDDPTAKPAAESDRSLFDDNPA